MRNNWQNVGSTRNWWLATALKSVKWVRIATKKERRANPEVVWREQ